MASGFLSNQGCYLQAPLKQHTCTMAPSLTCILHESELYVLTMNSQDSC